MSELAPEHTETNLPKALEGNTTRSRFEASARGKFCIEQYEMGRSNKEIRRLCIERFGKLVAQRTIDNYIDKRCGENNEYAEKLRDRKRARQNRQISVAFAPLWSLFFLTVKNAIASKDSKLIDWAVFDRLVVLMNRSARLNGLDLQRDATILQQTIERSVTGEQAIDRISQVLATVPIERFAPFLAGLGDGEDREDGQGPRGLVPPPGPTDGNGKH